MLVLTGTDVLFPLINEVFSPIIRQFKKINVVPFDEEDDTRDCVEKPLLSLEINPEELVKPETIHDLSSGRPYEIQLICHLLFRRIQQGKSTSMEITVDVLDDVLEELQTLQDTSDRIIINEIRSLNIKQLNAVKLLCASSGKSTLEQVWFVEYLVNAQEKWTYENLNDILDLLVDKGIIFIKDDQLFFSGDDFDRIYCKYYSRKHGVHLNIGKLPPKLIAIFRLRSNISNSLDCLESTPLMHTGVLHVGIQEVSSAYMLDESNDVKPIKNPFDLHPGIAKLIYKTSFDCLECPNIQVLEIFLSSPWYQINLWFALKKDKCYSDKCEKDLESVLGTINTRAEKLGGNLIYTTHEIPVFPPELLSKKVKSANSKEIIRDLSRYHYSKMVDEYLEKNIDMAILHAQLCHSYEIKPMFSPYANNLGYVFIAAKDFTIAETLFYQAIEKAEHPDEIALPKYNLGIIHAHFNDWHSAKKCWIEAKIEAEKIPEDEQVCFCLFVPKDQENQIIIDEHFNPNLLETINGAIEFTKTIKDIAVSE